MNNYEMPNLGAMATDATWQLFNMCGGRDKYNEKYATELQRKAKIPAYPCLDIVTVHIQAWPSTTLGFGGIGGQTITSAPTTVLLDETSGIHVVYFGGQYAYAVHHANDLFYEHCMAHELMGVAQHRQYEEKQEQIDGSYGENTPREGFFFTVDGRY